MVPHLSLVKQLFVIEDGVLFKVRKDGLRRQVLSVAGGALRALVAGQWYRGPDIAWALYHDSWPLYHIASLSLDPHDLSLDNLVACLRPQLRWRLTAVAGDFKHPLEAHFVFKSEAACRADWLRRARAYYAADYAEVRRHEQMRDAAGAGHDGPVEYQKRSQGRKSAKPVGAKPGKPPRPKITAQQRCYWFSGQWVVVPAACHPADDVMVRCAAVLAGAVRFEYDAALEVVQGFDADGRTVIA